jgi:S-adenosylmethionine-dependent methyltransferase
MIMDNVREYYNKHVEDEDKRLDYHPFEIPVTMHFVSKYLNPGSYFFDVACGTGRIAYMLLNKGYFAGLSDLADENIKLTRERLDSHRNIIFIERANAIENPYWSYRKWDAVFLLGPLYHMPEEKERLEIMKRAYENVKPGGYVFTSFMTRAGALIYGVKNNPEGIFSVAGARELWEKGSDKDFIEATKYFTNAWFTHPDDVNSLVSAAGLEPLHLAGAEGIFGERFELFHSMEKKLQDAWMEFIIDYCEDPRMVQHSKHLLSVARRPL